MRGKGTARENSPPSGWRHGRSRHVAGFGKMRAVDVGSYQGPQRRLFALRGAVQAEANEREAILAATADLMRQLIERNSLEAEAMVSCLFTTTADLDAEFPAVAARQLGLDTVPLLCCREIPVPGSMERVIRVMLHYYAAEDAVPEHVYVGATQNLRADLNAAQ